MWDATDDPGLALAERIRPVAVAVRRIESGLERDSLDPGAEIGLVRTVAGLGDPHGRVVGGRRVRIVARHDLHHGLVRSGQMLRCAVAGILVGVEAASDRLAAGGQNGDAAHPDADVRGGGRDVQERAGALSHRRRGCAGRTRRLRRCLRRMGRGGPARRGGRRARRLATRVCASGEDYQRGGESCHGALHRGESTSLKIGPPPVSVGTSLPRRDH